MSHSLPDSQGEGVSGQVYKLLMCYTPSHIPYTLASSCFSCVCQELPGRNPPASASKAGSHLLISDDLGSGCRKQKLMRSNGGIGVESGDLVKVPLCPVDTHNVPRVFMVFKNREENSWAVVAGES